MNGTTECDGERTKRLFLEYCRGRREHPSVDMGYVSESGDQFCFLWLDRGRPPSDFTINEARFVGAHHTGNPSIFVARKVT